MEDILLTSLQSLGVSIPPGVTSIQSLTPDSLFAICSQSLSFVEHTSSFPKSLPESTADRVKVCKDMADAVKELGYLGEISFHQFLYPSEDDLYKLVRFLIEKLSESGARITAIKSGNVERSSEYLSPKVQLLYVSETKHDESIDRDLRENVLLKEENVEHPLGVSRVNASEIAESLRSAKTGCDVYDPQTKEISNEKPVLKDFDQNQLEEDPKFLKTEMEVISNEPRRVNIYSEQLSTQIDAKRSKLMELKSQWSASLEPLEVKRKNILDNLCATATYPGAQDKYKNLKEIEAEIHSIESEITQTREECLKLSADLEKMPTVAPRKSFIQRINEITKNSRKLDADIERIIKETRELQVESNSTQESLHRTYAITGETVLRDGKTNPVGQQAYKLLKNIHDNFQQISDKILLTDRLKREAADHEKKLASMASQSLDVDKLQADLDAIRKENEALRNHPLQSST